MNKKLLEAIREIIIKDMMAVSTMEKAWPKWKKKIKGHLGNNPTGSTLLGLGDNLSDIFKSTSVSGRSQSTVSSSGKAWELLATWYLNLISANTRMIAFPKRTLVPKSILNAVTVSYQNQPFNSETDIIVIIFPESYDIEIDQKLKKKQILDLFLGIDSSKLNEFDVGIIQCKTNWNDNAQTPMLWNMVYSGDNFSKVHMSVGIEGYRVKDIGSFSYSFLTVPTVKIEKIKTSSLCVARVKPLTGGNFWGLKTKSGIASSIKEIFSRNFGNAFDSINSTAQKNLDALKKDLKYFKIY